MSRLEKALEGMTVSEWCQELNRRVFFWLDEKRLTTFLNAYSESEHDVIVVDGRGLADGQAERIKLSSINPGATIPFAAPRGRDTFKAIVEYPIRTSGGPAKALAELAIEYSVPDIAEVTLRVEHRRGRELVGVIWER